MAGIFLCGFKFALVDTEESREKFNSIMCSEDVPPNQHPYVDISDVMEDTLNPLTFHRAINNFLNFSKSDPHYITGKFFLSLATTYSDSFNGAASTNFLNAIYEESHICHNMFTNKEFEVLQGMLYAAATEHGLEKEYFEPREDTSPAKLKKMYHDYSVNGDSYLVGSESDPRPHKYIRPDSTFMMTPVESENDEGEQSEEVDEESDKEIEKSDERPAKKFRQTAKISAGPPTKKKVRKSKRHGRK